MTTATTIVMNETVTHVPDYDGHWKGEAYLTHHWYGEQAHRHSDEAERWNTMQQTLSARFGRPTDAACPDCEEVA